MAYRFLHAADIHLGYTQYGSNDRFRDFYDAFEQVVDYAIENKVDCVIIAGDLFHKRIIDPTTLYWTTRAFQRLYGAGIRAVAVQGNHELPDPRQKVSWLDFLARMKLLATLTASYAPRRSSDDEARLEFKPYDYETCKGAYLDVTPEIRVWGCKYVGAAMRRMLTDLAATLESGKIERKPYTIGVLHTGLQGVLDSYGGALSRADLEEIRPHCDYLALGHIHKPYEQDDWIYNPGSTEANSMTEVQWQDRGFYDVTVEQTTVDGQTTWRHTAKKVIVRGRKFMPISINASTLETPEALNAAVERAIKRNPLADEDRPVVELRLTGVLAFDRAQLDRDAIEARLRQAYDPIVCRVRDNTQPAEYEIRPDADMSPEQLERMVLRELVANDATKRGHASAWAGLVLNCKQLALGGNDPQPLLDEVTAFCERLDSGHYDEDEDDDADAPNANQEDAAC